MKKLKLSILLFAAVCSLAGCKDTNEEIVEEKVITFLEGYKQKDGNVSELLLGANGTDAISFEGISAYFADELEYEIKSCKREEENRYNVEVEVETIDFEQLFTTSYQETIEKYGEEGIADNFIREMEKNIIEKEYESNKIICNILVRKINDEFLIQMDSSFANALTGGMNEYLHLLQGGE